MASDRDEARADGGFHSYADDTPRGTGATAAAPIAAGWAETPAPAPEQPEDEGDEARSRSWPKLAAVTGAAMGVLAAAALGWSAMRKPDPRPAPEAPAVAEPTAAPPLQVVVTDPPPPPPLPKTTERLDVLPKGEVVAPPARAPLAQAVIPVAPAPGVVAAARTPDPLPLPAPSVAEGARDATAAPAPAPRFNACDEAPTLAMAMVCRDLRLAEADRRMKRAYRAALAAGVPERMLAEDQADWLEVREDAARVSPRAMADIYRQRTRELQAMADDERY